MKIFYGMKIQPVSTLPEWSPKDEGQWLYSKDTRSYYFGTDTEWVKCERDDHKVSHEPGGDDEIDVTGLSGLLSDNQTPILHKVSHELGEDDEIDVTGLKGLLADNQNPVIHKKLHESGGDDEISVEGLSGILTEDQKPIEHKRFHEPGGKDEIDVTGLKGILGDNQIPILHKKLHEPGGDDEINVTGLSGMLAEKQNPVLHGNTSHTTDYEPTFSKNTAFNKNFGIRAGTVCQGSDIRLSNARDPLTHASSHKRGSLDSIRLDELAVPNDNTVLNANTRRHGLLAKLAGGTTRFLRADGSWSALSVGQPQLRTAVAEASVTIQKSTRAYITLPGGDYGLFGIKIKSTNSSFVKFGGFADNKVPTLYTPIKGQFANTSTRGICTAYIQQKYIQASGEVFWYMALREITTKQILAQFCAPNHPCMMHNIPPEDYAHPWLDGFNPELHEVIVINPNANKLENIRQLRETTNRTVLEVIEQEYDIDDTVEMPWPNAPITIGLPPEWEEKQMGEDIIPIKKITKQTIYMRTATLKLKKGV